MLGEEDLVDVEEHPAPLSSLVQLIEDALRRRRPLLLAGIVDGLHHSDLLLLDAELAIECSQLRGSDLGVDELAMEELDPISQGEAAPLSKRSFRHQEVNVLWLEVKFRLLLRKPVEGQLVGKIAHLCDDIHRRE